MAFPLVTVLTAAPGIISAAADILRVVREKKSDKTLPDSDKIKELETLLEQQAQIIEYLAVTNRNLALAARNNRIIAVISLLIAIAAGVVAIWF